MYSLNEIVIQLEVILNININKTNNLKDMRKWLVTNSGNKALKIKLICFGVEKPKYISKVVLGE
jgi:hypothetical protein